MIPNAKVGYLVMQQVAGRWIETSAQIKDTIGQAVSVVDDYQKSVPDIAYAVAKVELVMVAAPHLPTHNDNDRKAE